MNIVREIFQLDFDEKAEEKIKRIRALDLGCIKFKLMDREDGLGWSRAQCDEVEEGYRRFLILLVVYPNENIVPTKLIDTFWHYHILDTQKYDRDCKNALGYFLHHFPYFGMRGAEDKQNLIDAGARTSQLYNDLFGESLSSLGESFSLCGPENCAGCNNACVGIQSQKFEAVRPTC